MPLETEQKLRLDDSAMARVVESRCEQLATHRLGVLIQRDEYFDTQDEQLRNGDFTVRVRRLAGRVVVALKGPRVLRPNGVYSRIELEFDVVDDNLLRVQLHDQGLIRTAVIDKRRVEFEVQQCVVAVDTVPFIGDFVEIEGPTPEAIDVVRSELGLSAAESVVENYTELLEKKFVMIGRMIRPALDATFESEK